MPSIEPANEAQRESAAGSAAPAIVGPTYDEMLYPTLLDPALRARALWALTEDELDPVNLFNITWKDGRNNVHRLILPPELTGVDANIVVLLGKYFPSGSHKVGPAYATLVEGLVDGDIIPGEHTILGPSTGNFGIGVAYVCRLMGYRAIVIMPDNMSRERYERIQKYGAELDLTPGTESDVILTLQRTYELKKDPGNRPLAQFELMPNYRFHRHVTGNSALEAVKDVGNGRVACFVSAPGSAGTLAAGDQIKAVFPDAKVAAMEPYECSTLATGGRGQHRIEGIGDKMCTLIHNVLNTDFVVLVRDDDSVKGLKLVQDGAETLVRHGVPDQAAAGLKHMFGVSGVGNVLAAIKMARFLRLGPGDNVVTVATDGFDRYPSVLEDLEKRYLEVTDHVLDRWFDEVFRAGGDGRREDTGRYRVENGRRRAYSSSTQSEPDVFDFRRPAEKERLFEQKQRDWLPFGYPQEYLDAMKSPSFWEDEYARVEEYNKKIMALREQKPNRPSG